MAKTVLFGPFSGTYKLAQGRSLSKVRCPNIILEVYEKKTENFAQKNTPPQLRHSVCLTFLRHFIEAIL